MDILLKSIRIQKFRSIEDLDLDLGLTNLLIGQNNAGKSNFLRAVNIALGSITEVNEADIFVTDDEPLTTNSTAIIDIRLEPSAPSSEKPNFSEFWTSVFTENLISQDTVSQFAFSGIRTEIKLNATKDNYVINRKRILDWGSSASEALIENKSFRFNEDMRTYISSFYMDASRDIVQDLRNKRSFFGRATSASDMEQEKIQEIEEQLNHVNALIVESIPSLTQTKDKISSIGRTIGSGNSSIEIEPLSRKLSDLNRGMDIVFQDGGTSLSISQNGHGTRSWVSFLTLSAFVDGQTEKIKLDDTDAEQYIMLTLEEPEAHLHPQAQRQLFGQIENFSGQKIISTHSPSVVAQSPLSNVIYFKKQDGKTATVRYNSNPSPANNPLQVDEDKIWRDVLNTRADLLFASAIIFCEGITEELALPVFFEEYFRVSPSSLDVSIINVGGGNYKSYLALIKDFSIPWFIFSDGETEAIKGIKSLVGLSEEDTLDEYPNIILLDNKDEYENYLITEGYDTLIIEAICEADNDEAALDSYILEQRGQKRKKSIAKKYYDGETLKKYDTDAARIDALRDMCLENKSSYARPVAKKIVEKADTDKKIPLKVLSLLDQVSEILSVPRIMEE